MKPLLLPLLLASTALAATRPSTWAIAVPYANDRQLLATDFLRLPWHDEARNRDVPVKIYFPADAAGPVPVVLFSHGLGGTRETYEYLGRQWAANGYVVVHLQHVGSDDSAWRGQDRPMQSMRRAINVQGALDRVGDVKFVLDQLEAI